MTTTPTTTQQVDVTSVIASIDQGEALRDRIKALNAELKIHEDNIKDALGDAVEGVDATGKVLVRYPHRSNSGLDRKKVEALLSPEDFAASMRITNYRTLLYGEG